MIELLTVLTVAYAIILVLVLAATLITILYYLRKIGSTLGQIADGLQVVERQTAPLAEKIDAINGGLGAISTGLHGAAGHLAATDELLASVAGETPDVEGGLRWRRSSSSSGGSRCSWPWC
jgi:hypothetical protein